MPILPLIDTRPCYCHINNIATNMAAGLYDITHEVLGKGHFAVVKLARHCLTSELVAVKIVDKTKLTAESLQQHSQEVRLLSRLSEHEHPNIVKLYQVINTKTKLYLVMEYCGRDVCDLYDYIQKKYGGSGLPESEAKHIFRQISSAIEYCHSLKIVHRDLKPENLLIITQPTTGDDGGGGSGGDTGPSSLDNATQLTTSSSTTMNNSTSSSNTPPPPPTLNNVSAAPTAFPFKYPIVKLIDFGFANQWQEGHKLRTSCGSLAYSAPEILLGDQYDGDKVDVWGLGCILYILLYGCNPFMQINDNETLIRILDCSFSTPARPTISPAAIQLIRSLLVREPNGRLVMQQLMSHSWFDGLESDPIFHTSTGVTVSSPPPVVPSTSSTPSSSSQTSPVKGEQHSNISTPSSTPSPSHTTTSTTALGGKEAFVTVAPVSSGVPYLPTHVSRHVSMSSTPFSLRSKSPSTVNEVHERVINEMIAQKMCPSKERVERALRLARVNSGHRTSIPSLPVVGEGVPMESTGSYNNNHINNNNGNTNLEGVDEAEEERIVEEDDRVSDSYIMATYNLLKDKMLREIQGIPNNTPSVHDITKAHTKRSHALPGAGRRRGGGVSQAPRFGRPLGVAGLDDLSLKKQLMEEEMRKAKDVQEEDSFVLPLQRKCSIVSEEGSCDLSGRLSDTGSDTLHTLLMVDDKEGVIVKRAIPSVDIVITDVDQTDEEIQEKESAGFNQEDNKNNADNEGLGDVTTSTIEDVRREEEEAEYDLIPTDLADDVELKTCTDIVEEDDDVENLDKNHPDVSVIDGTRRLPPQNAKSKSSSTTDRGTSRKLVTQAPCASPELYDDVDEYEEDVNDVTKRKGTSGDRRHHHGKDAIRHTTQDKSLHDKKMRMTGGEESTSLAKTAKSTTRSQGKSLKTQTSLLETSTNMTVTGTGTNNNNNTSSNQQSATTGRGLHLVSSSPDFAREYGEECLRDSEDSPDMMFVTDREASTAPAERGTTPTQHRRNSHHRPLLASMIREDSLSHKNKAVIVDDVADHVESKRHGRRGSRPRASIAEGPELEPSQPTSVRIITQSKSCNDIMCKDNGSNGSEGGKNGKGGSSRSGSRKNSKRRHDLVKQRSRGERTDCCCLS